MRIVNKLSFYIKERVQDLTSHASPQVQGRMTAALQNLAAGPAYNRFADVTTASRQVGPYETRGPLPKTNTSIPAAREIQMLDEAIIHVSRSNLSQSSRIQYQLFCDGGAHIGGTKFLDYATIRLILRNPCAKQVVFHQHNCLGNLALALLLRKIYRKKISFVFDIHDLLEFQTEFMTIKSLAFYLVAISLQRLILSSDVGFMTVSPDIANLIEEKYEVKVETVLNTASRMKSGTASQRADRKKIVYFGSINDERLNKKYLWPLFEAGFSLDVFGFFSNTFTERDLKKLAPDPDQIKYLGKYNGQDITELVSCYSASWMVYESRYKNYHFCLPNKLFQSLSVGTPCIVHNDMVSSRRLIDAGFKVYTSEEFLLLECAPRSSIELYGQYERQNSKRYIDFLTCHIPAGNKVIF